jgi:glucose/arabinose dehydrogenase
MLSTRAVAPAALGALLAASVVVVALPTDSRGHPGHRSVEPAHGRSAVGPPAGFSDRVVATAVAPTALAWTPDDRMIVTSKGGQVLVGEDEDGPLTVALDLGETICDQEERGLVGVAVDPAFEKNQFVYVYWTRKTRGSCTTPAPDNRITRFRLGDDNRVVPGSQTVIVDHIVSPQAHHLAGDLEFGADGYLYVSVGDGVCALTGERQ